MQGLGVTGIIDESLVGATSAEKIFRVSRADIRRFAAAIGDRTLAHTRGDVAPPTYPAKFLFRLPIKGLDIDDVRALHGEQEYWYERPIRAGDRLLCMARVTEVARKTGSSGEMILVVIEQSGSDAERRPVFHDRGTFIFR
jgi:hydroxyacyl-ACP dehydratase HTD2-like protein with hotdog domain